MSVGRVFDFLNFNMYTLLNHQGQALGSPNAVPSRPTTPHLRWKFPTSSRSQRSSLVSGVVIKATRPCQSCKRRHLSTDLMRLHSTGTVEWRACCDVIQTYCTWYETLQELKVSVKHVRRPKLIRSKRICLYRMSLCAF